MAKLQKGINDLKTWCLNNGDFGQQLLNEWTGQCDDGKQYEIDEVSFGSNKKFKWKCIEGHEWIANINCRSSQKRCCPYCSGNLVSDKNSLKNWCLNNGDWGQQLLNEWTGDCDDGKHYEIDEVSFGSNKKFKWRCSKGHEWYATIINRKNGTSCRQCNKYNGTSYPEQFIYWSLKQLYPNAENRCRVLKSPQNPHGIEFDIGIPDIPLCIEYSPTGWHRDKKEHDALKKELCAQSNVRLIQIIDDSYDELEHIISDNYICFKMDYNKQEETIVYIIDHILKSLGHSISEIDIELVRKNAWEYSKGKVEYEKSLEYMFPELVKEWHNTLNANIKPDEITCGSGKLVYWVCPNCNYGECGEWKAQIHNRAYNASGCPKCGYTWIDGKTHVNSSTIITKGINDLQSQYPELAKEWHQTLNRLRSDEVKRSSGKKIYWQCQKCGYGSDGEWCVAVCNRVHGKSGCPSCGYNWSDGKIYKTYGSKIVIKGVNDIQSIYPRLAEEWHQTLNINIKPTDMLSGSHKAVYWQCNNCNYGSTGAWRSTIRYRITAKSGCPKCGYNWFDTKIHNVQGVAETGINDLQSQHPELAKEWHPTLNKDLKPDKIKCGSCTKIYWQCQKCNYGLTGEWYIGPHSRTYRKSGCPRCNHNWYKSQQGLPQKYKGKYSHLNNPDST